MGEMIIFQESFLSVPFTITNRLFDLLSQMVCYVFWQGISGVWTQPFTYKYGVGPQNGAFFTPCPTKRVLSVVETTP